MNSTMEEEGNKDNAFEEAADFALPTGVENDMEIDSGQEEEEGEGEEKTSASESENEEFEGDLDACALIEDGTTTSHQLDQQFENMSYEALAERKRKALAIQSKKPRKKSREENNIGASFQEIMEAMNYGSRRKSKTAKKRGRRKGSRNQESPEVKRLLGEATLHYAAGNYAEAIKVLKEVVRLAPTLPDAYHTLGLIYVALGDKQKAMNFYRLAAELKPKDSTLWKLLLSWSLEEGDTALVRKYLSKAIVTDPEDIHLRFHRASLYTQLGDSEKAAKSYEQILQLHPDHVEACKAAAKLYKDCGQVEKSLRILEDYLKNQPSDDLSIVDMLVTTCMESGKYEKALHHIEECSFDCSSPSCLTAKAGICSLHVGNLDKAEGFFKAFQLENANDHGDLIVGIANSLKMLGHYESALTYYLMLDKISRSVNGILYLKIADCYLSLKLKQEAVPFLYKAVNSLEDSAEARITLASLLLEDEKEEEAVSLLSPPSSELRVDISSDKSKLWWLNEKVKLKLASIYRAKMMLEEFVDVFFPLISQSLTFETTYEYNRPNKKLPTCVYRERAIVLDNCQTDYLFQGLRPVASSADLAKASRAKRVLQKRLKLKEEMKAKAIVDGLDWPSEDSDDDAPSHILRKRCLPQFLKDEENHQLLVDLCRALASLQRYDEALHLCQSILRMASSSISLEKKDEFLTLGAQIAHNAMDPTLRYNFACHILQQHPYDMAAWNYYYKVISRLQILLSKHSRFLQRVRDKKKDCVPPIIIAGHQFSMISQHQAAAREYLEAYKVLPDNPFINLCAGTALINLTLNLRLHNKHQSMVQGMAFLYNNLRLCGGSQEALYNIARAYHQVGLTSLAASYYEKVLATREKDYPLPKLLYENQRPRAYLKPGYCNLRREAAYNLHLIYKRSGAYDLARQVLRDHCTL